MRIIKEFRNAIWGLVVIILLFATTLCTAKLSDSVIILRYSLEKGKTYTWNLVADQFIVNGRALRLSATYNIDAIDSDVDGNTQVRIRTSPSSINTLAGGIIDSVKDGIFPVGSRKTNKAGVYDAMIDQLGNILTGQYNINHTTNVPVMSGQGLTNQTDANQSLDIPLMMNMMMPIMPLDPDIKMRVSKIDTILIPSVNQIVSGSRGSISRNDKKSKVLMDTLYRIIELDSIKILHTDKQICFMTVHSVKKTINGTTNIIKTSIVRDTRSGVFERIIEQGFYSDSNGKIRPIYVAVALIDKIIDFEHDNVLTPPLIPSGSR